MSTILALLLCGISKAQEPVLEGERVEVPDEVIVDDKQSSDDVVVSLDSLFIVLPNGDKEIKSLAPGQLGHSPHTATMYAAILPGLGQIYNKKYWKLPLLYGGVGALCYAIHFNSKYYKKYKSYYRDFVIGDPNNKSYAELFKPKKDGSMRVSITIEQAEGQYRTQFTRLLSNQKNYYRRYRDLSYFGMIGLYVVQIVDAAVDAHFFKFDVNEDLSLQWQPTLRQEDLEGNIGASICITF